MNPNKSIVEAITERISSRTYKTKAIENNLIKQIENYINLTSNTTGPFDTKIKIVLQDIDNYNKDQGIKLGTYGVIKGAKTFIVGAIKNGNNKMVDYGYVLEKLILFLTQLNLGTCWLGGTFSRKSFSKVININENEIIPAITPVGYVKNKRSFMDSTIRFMAKSSKRKDWDKLFFDGTFDNPLLKENAGDYSIPLEMIRLAPSASNKQPWIVVKDKNRFHFYLNRNDNYSGNTLGFEIQRIDIGIAMCHFELTSKELDLKGGWIVKNPNINIPKSNIHYIISWISES